MVNYPNNMRYCRMGNSCVQPRMNYGNLMNERESCGCMKCVENEMKNCEDFQEMEICGKLEAMPLAMAYVPWQKWCNTYDICKGFQRGTIFYDLDKPFLGRGGCNR